MPIQGDLNYARPENMYAGSPVEEVKALNADASNQYNTSKQNMDALDLLANSIQVEDRAAPIKKKAIDNIKSQFADLVKNGNYQDAQYLVQKATKDFHNNNELKDAIKSKQMEQSYLSEQKKRLDEGKITPDAYKWAVTRSMAANKEPLKYNPDTYTTENMFSGQNVLDDKSKEIYDKTYQRINDWKASSTPFEFKNKAGNLLKVQYVDGILRDLQTKKEVDEKEVYSALKTEVEKEYEPYLKQERDIQNYKKFYNPETGQYRQVQREDIPLIDKDLKVTLTGISESGLNSLKAKADKGEKGAKLAYQEALKRYNSVNLADPKVLEQAYLQYQKNSQLDNYVAPAASKAGFIDVSHDFRDSKEAELALQHKYKMAEINYEKTYTAPLPTDYSQLQEFTTADYEKSVEEDNKVKDQLTEAQAQLAEAQKSGNQTYIANANRKVEDLKYLNQTAQNRQLEFVKKLSDKDPEVAKQYISHNFQDIATEVLNNPQKYSSALAGEVAKIVGMAKRDTRQNYNSYGSSTGGISITGKGENKTDFEKLSDNAKENIQTLWNQIEKEKNKDDLLKTAINGTSNNYQKVPARILLAIDNAKQKHGDTSISYQTNIFGIDDKTDKSWEKPIMDRTADLVKNTASNWLIGNVSLDQIASGEAKDFEMVNGAGQTVRPNLSKSEIRPEINHISGLNTVRVLFKDDKGNPLYLDGDKKSQAAISLTPSDQSGISTLYRQLGNTLIKSQDGNAQKQGYKILGYTDFAPSLNGIHLTNMSNGEEKNVIIPSSTQGDMNVKIKKGVGGIEAMIENPPNSEKFVPLVLKDYSGKETNTFGSKEQFEELLKVNGY